MERRWAANNTVGEPRVYISVERSCTWGLSETPLLSQSQQHFTDHGHFRSSRLTITARVCLCVTTGDLDAVATTTTSFATKGVVVLPDCLEDSSSSVVPRALFFDRAILPHKG